MLSLSQSVGYAVRALTCMEGSACQPVLTRDIADCSGVPPAYLAKIFKRLADGGMLQSKRGWAGGTRLARLPEKITLFQISEVLEGEEFLRQCLLGEAICSDERSCPMHIFWKAERQRIREQLSATTLADVIEFEKRRGKNGKGCTSLKQEGMEQR